MWLCPNDLQREIEGLEDGEERGNLFQILSASPGLDGSLADADACSEDAGGHAESGHGVCEAFPDLSGRDGIVERGVDHVALDGAPVVTGAGMAITRASTGMRCASGDAGAIAL
jgi:hypothetical protein